MLDKCPKIAGLWDRESLELKPDFEKNISGMSSGEKIMAQLMAGISIDLISLMLFRRWMQATGRSLLIGSKIRFFLNGHV